MKPDYSNSVLLAWQVADLEAKRLEAAFLEPAHLLLGLCKSVDIDLSSLVPDEVPDRVGVLGKLFREIGQLQGVFKEAGFDAMRFRRYYRAVLPEGSAGLNSNQGRLHRTDAAKDVFCQAEQLAMVERHVVLPLHLLCALLQEEDAVRDETMVKAGAEPGRLLECAKRLLFLDWKGLGAPVAGTDPITWN